MDINEEEFEKFIEAGKDLATQITKQVQAAGVPFGLLALAVNIMHDAFEKQAKDIAADKLGIDLDEASIEEVLDAVEKFDDADDDKPEVVKEGNVLKGNFGSKTIH